MLISTIVDDDRVLTPTKQRRERANSRERPTNVGDKDPVKGLVIQLLKICVGHCACNPSRIDKHARSSVSMLNHVGCCLDRRAVLHGQRNHEMFSWSGKIRCSGTLRTAISGPLALEVGWLPQFTIVNAVCMIGRDIELARRALVLCSLV